MGQENNTGRDNYGWVFSYEAGPSEEWADLSASENATSANRPKLIINYTEAGTFIPKVLIL